MEGGEAGRFAQAGDGFENNDLFNEDSPELTRSLAEPRFDAGGSGAASSVEQSTRSFSNMSRLLQKAVSYSTTVFQVFSSDPVSVNLAVFELWIRGLREEQVVYFQRTNLGVASESDHAECELLLLLYRNVIDQYRMLHVLEEFLVYPKLLQRQLQVQLSPQIREYMVDRYFEISDSVIRELLGKKLTTRARKDLYEVSELTKNLIPSCRRQFDNLRRIFNMLDEKNFEGNLPAAIVEQFMLRWDMAERYTCIVFLLYNRFNLQSNKKKTCFIPLFDLEYCAAIMILFWVTETTYTSSTEDIKRFTGDQYFQAQDNVVLPSFTEDDQGEDDGGQNELDDEEEASDESDEMVELDDDEDEEAGDIVDETDVGIDEGGGSGQEERIHAKAANRRSVRAGELSQRLLNTPRLSSRLLERRRTTSLNRPVVPEYQKPPGNTSLDISPHLIIKWRMIKNHFFWDKKIARLNCQGNFEWYWSTSPFSDEKCHEKAQDTLQNVVSFIVNNRVWIGTSQRTTRLL
mmetsp:Transcript_12950/g.23336  ORF Transcript_12950/g.23336 Transcript_12950/m.23336 type:complete len:517 (-) Transcript_12950:3540-5090(-)